MKSSTFTLLASLLATAGLSVSAQAAELNIGGSSAITDFATEVPLSMCDAPPAALPNHYVNDGSQTDPVSLNLITNGKLHVWTCTRGGVPTTIRYAATGSSDGINRIKATVGTPDAQMAFLDHTSGSCNSPILTTRPSDGKQYNDYQNCSGSALEMDVHLGGADVHGSSFGQAGPLPTKVDPIDQTGVVSTQVAIVPFEFVLGAKVCHKNTTTGLCEKVASLSHYQVQGLLSNNITDWRQIGLFLGDVGSAPDDETVVNSVSACHRISGSGTKATLDQVVMTQATEWPIGSTDLTNAAPGHYFGKSNQDIRDCVGGNAGVGRPAHPGAIGYMESIQAWELDAQGLGAYVVKMDSFQANYPTGTVAERKRDLRCGRWKYWVGERLNHRNPASADPTQNQLILDFVTVSGDAATIAILPAGEHWDAPGDMKVFKNADPGPVLFKTGNAAAECGS